jgi:hypothetical protein
MLYDCNEVPGLMFTLMCFLIGYGFVCWFLSRCQLSCVDSLILYRHKMIFGRVNALGQFISDFDPGPENDKKGIGQSTSFVL